MSVSITFQRVQQSEDQFSLEAKLAIGDHSENDIEVLWARLAMGYCHEIFEVVRFDATRHIKDEGATLTFFRDSEDGDFLSDEYDNFDDVSGELVDDMMDALDEAKVDASKSIGFSLQTGNAYLRIGGLSVPSVTASTLLYKALLVVRNRCAVEQASTEL